MADFTDRSLGIGYPGGASILFALLIVSLAGWYWSVGSVSVDKITSPKVESFDWTTILFSQTLGTALGDWMADTNGLGYEGGALVFAAGLVPSCLPIFTPASRGRSCSGAPSSSLGLWERPWAICSTSPSIKEGSI